MEYYVYITNDCNMNCKYCSVLFDTARFGIPKSPQYLLTDLERFINSTQKSLDDNVADIYFFGGEPTTNYQCISDLIRCFEKPREYLVNFIMHTNGLLIPNAPANILNRINLTILSFNYELVYNNGHISDYLNKMIKAIDCLKESNNNPIIGRITVSPKTSLYTECCLISNFVDYVYWQIDNCIMEEEYKDYYNHYTNDIALLYRYWITCLKKGVFLRFVPFMSAVRNLIYDIAVPTKFFCGYGSSMIYIQTDGKCYACCDNVATNSHYLGDIFSGVNFPEIDLKKTICKNCKYIKLCGGRCGRMHKDFSENRKTQYCSLNQFMFDLIIDDIEKIKKIILSNKNMEEKLLDPMIAYTEYTS